MHRPPGNILSRLLSREVAAHRPGTPVHTIRSYYDVLHPNTSLLNLDSPPVHFCRFTPDGRYLVCFASAGQELVVYSVRGLSTSAHACDGQPHESSPPATEQPARSFGSFFQLDYHRMVVSDAREQLVKDFCLSTRGGAFLLLASQSPAVPPRGRTAAAAAAREGAAGNRLTERARPVHEAAQPQQQAQQQAGAVMAAAPQPQGTRDEQRRAAAATMTAVALGVLARRDAQQREAQEEGGDGARGWQPAADAAARDEESDMVPGVPSVQSTTLHLVRASDGEVLDRVVLNDDFVHLHHHSGVSMHGDVVTVLAIRSQTTHVYHVTRDGRLLPAGRLGPHCADDDELELRRAAVAEEAWVAAQKQAQEQAQQQARKRLRRGKEEGSGAAAGAFEGMGVDWGAASTFAAAPAGGGARTAAGAGAGAGAGPHEQPAPPQQQQALATLGGAPGQQQRAMALAQQQQLQQRRGIGLHAARPGGVNGGNTTASDAPPLAPMIGGVRQRMLAYLFSAPSVQGPSAGSSPRQVQASARWFHRSFDSLCDLVVWRVQMLSRTHVLMDLGCIVPPDAPGQMWTPHYSQYFMLYDIVAERVVAFFRATSDELLPLLLRHAAELQGTAGASVWDRFAFTPAHAAVLAQSLGVSLPPPRAAAQSTQPRQQQQQGQQQGRQGQGQEQGQARSGQQLSVPSSSAPTLSRALASAAALSAGGGAADGGGGGGGGDGGGGGEGSSGHHHDAAAQRARDASAALKRLQAAVPGSPQALCASPLLDPGLFVYDDRLVGPAIRPRPAAEQPVKFFVRSRPDRAAFRLEPPEPDAPAATATAATVLPKRTTLHLFHPALPLVLSVSQGQTKPSTPLGAAGGEWATPHLWLEHGVSGQPNPGRLVAGLHQLVDLDEFMIAIEEEMPGELAAKARALGNPERRSQVLVMETSSMDAQHEVLQLLLDYLPTRYPRLYTLEGSAHNPGAVLCVHPTGERFCVADFTHCPLEMAARVVQEDLVLMRSAVDGAGERRASGSRDPTRPATPPGTYVMCAACVVFSFSGLPGKLSAPLGALHAPVPGFESQLLPLLNRMFDGLKVGRPLWRNNWGLADSGAMDSPLYGSPAAASARAHTLCPHERWLRTEYQTLRRLPVTGAVLFTVRTFTEQLGDLARSPQAAACLAASLRGMSPAMRAYKGLGDPRQAIDTLQFLDALAVQQQGA
ncbi:hypothetical protein FOA52_006531 [Chlamydomonas sp. UWO 241]|nr:hypothetical protein FOA52_006531 [Chlamydomonas sp. UWO 241]